MEYSERNPWATIDEWKQSLNDEAREERCDLILIDEATSLDEDTLLGISPVLDNFNLIINRDESNNDYILRDIYSDH